MDTLSLTFVMLDMRAIQLQGQNFLQKAQISYIDKHFHKVVVDVDGESSSLMDTVLVLVSPQVSSVTWIFKLSWVV